MASIRYSFTLDPATDTHLATWLKAQHNASAAIRIALLAYITRPTARDIAAKLDLILARLDNVQTVRATDDQEREPEQDEPTAAQRGLDAMIEHFRQSGQADQETEQ